MQMQNDETARQGDQTMNTRAIAAQVGIDHRKVWKTLHRE